MELTGPLWLIGMMGAGKSAVAPLVAERLGISSIDSDALVEARTGQTISQLFAKSEETFRAAELEVIESLEDAAVVVAVGGGAVTTQAARTIRRSGFAVWLRASLGSLVERVGDDRARPLLARDVEAALARLEVERAGQYQATADAVVETDGLTPAEVADLVVEAWKNAQSAA